ncbi:putative e3 ubiquitin-protein ligase rhy1a [Quercus suber]|uniref:E3 ubiquitin-protein ligase rhy1a n=1 Tax=Quercus suber TaxID=58331 RepID=A0AAW0IXX4_QUESU
MHLMLRQMYFLEDRTPSFCTSIAGTSWRTEEILDDMKKCGHGVQIIQHHDFFLDDCLGEYLLLFPKLLKKVEKLKLMCLHANTENLSSTSRPGLIENEDRLLGAVLLARARLLERGSGRPYRDLGTQASAGQSAGGSSISSLTSRIKRPQLLLKPKKKSPGLSQEALDCLHLEVFSSKVEGAVSRASQDLVCLETFVEGDALIHLPCSHNFHSACLDPWLRTCGDCPYCCRTITIVTSHNKASMS